MEVRSMVSDEELMARARKRAEEKVGFFIHLSVYAVINGLFILGWWFSGTGARGSSSRWAFGA